MELVSHLYQTDETQEKQKKTKKKKLTVTLMQNLHKARTLDKMLKFFECEIAKIDICFDSLLQN